MKVFILIWFAFFIIVFTERLEAKNLINNYLGIWALKDNSYNGDAEVIIRFYLNELSETDISVSLALTRWTYHNCKITRVPGIVFCKEGSLFMLLDQERDGLFIEFSKEQIHIIEDLHFETSTKRSRFRFQKIY